MLLITSSTENLKQLITSSKECGITFYYALSPGLDILFSNTRDVQLLKKKMDQVVIVVLIHSAYKPRSTSSKYVRKVHLI